MQNNHKHDLSLRPVNLAGYALTVKDNFTGIERSVVHTLKKQNPQILDLGILITFCAGSELIPERQELQLIVNINNILVRVL